MNYNEQCLLRSPGPKNNCDPILKLFVYSFIPFQIWCLLFWNSVLLLPRLVSGSQSSCLSLRRRGASSSSATMYSFHPCASRFGYLCRSIVSGTIENSSLLAYGKLSDLCMEAPLLIPEKPHYCRNACPQVPGSSLIFFTWMLLWCRRFCWIPGRRNKIPF